MSRAPTEFHPRWSAWLLENLAEDAGPADLVDALIAEGLEPARARSEVDALIDSPALAGARMLVRRIRALEQVVRLRHSHRAVRPEGHTIVARRPFPGSDAFLAEHWVPGVPVVFTDLVAPRWPPQELADRFGDVMIEACVGRASAVDPDPDWQPLRREMPLRELVRLVLSPETGNDVYMLAKNNATRRPGLQPLLAELVLPSDLFGPCLDLRRSSLWIGPAGTHTPLHHDTDNSLLCQLHGRKRVRLAPPESLPLLALARGVYSEWDPRAADDQGAPERLLELEVDAGDALFIPAGWWHQVDALTPSVTVTNLGFVWPNDHSWYRPGVIL